MRTRIDTLFHQTALKLCEGDSLQRVLLDRGCCAASAREVVPPSTNSLWQKYIFCSSDPTLVDLKRALNPTQKDEDGQ
jgi:hypothetical protein